MSQEELKAYFEAPSSTFDVAEETATGLHQKHDSQGYDEIEQDVKVAGDVAAAARRDVGRSNLVNPWYPLRTFLNYPKRNARSGRCQHQQRGKKHSLMQRISARTKKPRLPSPHYFPKGATMGKNS